MAAPTIPAANSQAVQTVQAGGTIPFVLQWWNFFNALLAYVTSGPIGPVPLAGVTDGSSAAAGNIGEYISSIFPVNPGIAIANNTNTTVTSVSLTAGDWDLWGEVAIFISGGTAPQLNSIKAALWTTPANASPSSGSVPSDGVAFGWQNSISGQTEITDGDLLLPTMRISITGAAVTYYLSALITFSNTGGTTTATAGAAIRARRVR